MEWVWSTHVEIHVVYSLTWDRFRCMLCPLLNGISLVNTCWQKTFHVFAGMVLVFVNTSWDTFCVLACVEGVWSTYVEMHFVSSLAWEGLVQHLLRIIICPCRHGRSLVNTSWGTICVHVSMVGVWSTLVVIHNVFTLAWEWFGQQRFSQHFWDIFCFLAGIKGVWSTHFEIHIVISLPWKWVGLHMLRCIWCPHWHWMCFCQHMFRFILCPRCHGRLLVNTS